MTLLIQILILAWLVVSPAWACDSKFIYEPTTRDADATEVDTWAGMVARTWIMLDGRILTTVYIITQISIDDTVETLPFPLFYTVRDKTGTTITYIDPEGKG